MQFENSFTVPLPPQAAWPLLMDIERIAPCVPGAELTGKLDDRSYKGRIGVRLGPVALTFAGTAKFEEIDEAAQTARVKASGTDAKGRGGAAATASFRLEPVPEGTRVVIGTDLALSGAVGQYGRGVGMIEAVAAQIVKQFAEALRSQIAADAAVAAAPEPTHEPATAEAGSLSSEGAAPRNAPAPSPRPISGLSLLLKAVWSWIAGRFSRVSLF